MKTITIDYDEYLKEIEEAKKQGFINGFNQEIENSKHLVEKIKKIERRIVVRASNNYYETYLSYKQFLDFLVDVLNEGRKDDYILYKGNGVHVLKDVNND